ncbi:hypothetical protein K2W90_05965 [Candidatus Babeliales bacterium]|nr:hypothetical protein [Candidatus Babeliales bacterium]
MKRFLSYIIFALVIMITPLWLTSMPPASDQAPDTTEAPAETPPAQETPEETPPTMETPTPEAPATETPATQEASTEAAQTPEAPATEAPDQTKTMPDASEETTQPADASEEQPAETPSDATADLGMKETTTKEPKPAEEPKKEEEKKTEVTGMAPATTGPTKPTTVKEALKFHKEELNQIDTSMKTIQTNKDALKKQLRELDAKLGEAQAKAAEAKDIGFNVLQKDSEKGAQEDLAKIKQLIADIKTIREFVDSSFAQTFHDNITAIKVQIALIDQTIKTLQAQYPNVSLGELAKEQPAEPAKEKAKESGTIATTITKFTAWLVSSLKQVKDWMLSPSAIEEQKKKSNAEEKSKNGQQSGPVSDQVNKDIAWLNKSIEELDKKILTYSTMYKELKELIKELRARFDSVPVIQAYLLLTEDEKKPEEKLYWRRMAEHIFEKFLDLTAMTVEIGKNLVIKAYNYFLAGTVRRFTQDVQEKIAEMETRKIDTENLKDAQL